MWQRWGLLLLAMLSLATCFDGGAVPPQLTFASDRSGHGDLFLLDQRGRLQNLTRSPSPEWDPAWSPQGQMLLYTGYEDNQADIWMLDLQTGQRRNLTQHPAWDYAADWSPDGRNIVFISERDGEAEIFTQPLSGGPARQHTHNDHIEKNPRWSPQDNQLVYAAIVNGREMLYLLNLDDDTSVPLLSDDTLSGTSPAWHPDGTQVAFVGWTQPAQIGLYRFNLATRSTDLLYSAEHWLGSLTWSGDGCCLLFTEHRGGNHNLALLTIDRGTVQHLTHNIAWDDFPTVPPGARLRHLAPVDSPNREPIDSAAGALLTGVNLADLAHAYLIQDMQFAAIKGYVNWATVETEPGQFRWVDPDNVLHAAEGAGAQVLLRIHGTPSWARPPDTVTSHPPTALADFEHFLTILATRYQGRVAAYEIWNEPNLNYEWGYRDPSPAEYTALLQAAYRAIKAADPAAVVVSGGLAPTGGGSAEAMSDLLFLEGMYQAGARGHFDALGSHPYSYGLPPDAAPPDTITFAEVARQHALMARYNDAATPIWITEMGWVLETHWDLGEYHSQGVDLLQQAAYLRRAHEKIETEWPFVEAVFLFNLDFSIAPWYAAPEQMRWYAILNPDRSPRPAFTTLREWSTASDARRP